MNRLARKLVVVTRGATTRSERTRYDRDLASSELVPSLQREMERFESAYGDAHLARGKKVTFGSSIVMATAYYYLVRKHRPKTVVETGVCNGMSTAFLLQALADNGEGSLYSIDYPEVIGEEETSEHWSGKGGAAIPPGSQSGWLVPERLRSRWQLTLGKSTDKLRPLLEELGTIDCFVHDSEHSYECMMFEFSVAWRHLRDGGVLASNDIQWNRSFFDFSFLRGRVPLFLTANDAFIVK